MTYDSIPRKALDTLVLSDGDRRNLSSSIGLVSSGYPDDDMTPLGKRVGRERLSDDIHHISVKDVDARIVELEEDELAKVGIRSIRLPWAERRETVTPYWEKTDFSPDAKLFNQAVANITASLLRLGTLRPISVDNAARRSPSNTNLGLPHLTRNLDLVQEYIDRAKAVKDPADIFPSFAWWRGKVVALGEPIDPGRLVWGFDHAETYLSGTYLHPAIGTLRRMPEFAAWVGPDGVDDVVRTYIRPFVHNREGYAYISVDYSGYDTTISREAISAVFSVLRSLFVGNDAQLDLIEEIIATSGLVTPDGWLIGRNGSMPSGTSLTNLIDGIWNLIIIEYCALRFGAEYRASVQGDDAIIGTNLKYEDLITGSKELGMVASEDKSLESDITAHYLRRLYLMDKGSPGIYPISRTASSLTGYERFQRDWDENLEAMRTLMLLRIQNITRTKLNL